MGPKPWSALILKGNYRPYILKLIHEDERQKAVASRTDTLQSKKRKFTPDQPSQVGSGKSGVAASPSKRKRAEKFLDDDGDATIPTSDADEDEMQMLHANPRRA